MSVCDDTGFNGSLLDKVLQDRREDTSSNGNARFIGRQDLAPIDLSEGNGNSTAP